MLDKMVAVEPLYDKDLSPSGLIYIPDQAKERCDQGLIKYKGANVDPTLKIGSHVIFSAYSGETIQMEGEGTLIFLHHKEIAAIIEDQPCDINGLYFRDTEGEYFTATYEQAMHLISSNLNVINRIDRSYDPDNPKRAHSGFSKSRLSESESENET